MVSPGNHDTGYSFQIFQETFKSPNYENTSNYFYTFTIGDHLFLSYNPEVDANGKKYTIRYTADIYEIMKSYLQ